MKSPSLQGTLTPSYGRDYKSKVEAVTDFRNGLDFTHNLMGQTCQCSVRDYKEGDMVKIRYDRLTKAAFYRVVKEDEPTYGERLHSAIEEALKSSDPIAYTRGLGLSSSDTDLVCSVIMAVDSDKVVKIAQLGIGISGRHDFLRK